MAGDAEQLGAGVVGPADAGEPGRAAAHDVGHDRDRFHVVDGGRAAIEPDIGRERRLEPRLALLAFQAFEQRGFLAADIGAGAVMDDEVEIPAVDVVLADQLRLIGLIDRRLQVLALADEFAAHIDVAGMRAPWRSSAIRQPSTRRCGSCRMISRSLQVPGSDFVGIDHEIMRPLVDLLGHERPFEPGREAGAAAAAQARLLHLVDDGVAALFEDRLGAVPGAARARALRGPSPGGRRDCVKMRSLSASIGYALRGPAMTSCQRGRAADRRRELPAVLRAGLRRLAARDGVEHLARRSPA